MTSDAIAGQIERIAGSSLLQMEIVRLDLQSTFSRFTRMAFDKIVPARKLLIYRDNLEFFRQFDAIVVTEKTSLILKTRYGLDQVKIIHTRHGAGDRSIGFNKESALFDLSLVAGEKIARRLQAEAGVSRERIAITGYAKFDLYADVRADLPFPDSDKPTVLYNPHPSPRLSSWFAMGERVLNELTASDRYNVIFAPHVMLFARRNVVTIAPPAFRRVRALAPALTARTNLLVDQGSAASTDMSYTNAADIYIGDVSSQVYEFLRRPRPCLHLDAHGVDWRDDPSYLHWHAGPVAGRRANIVEAVDEAIATHGDYLASQRAMLADTFSITDETAANRSAHAILDLLNG
ncbi:hypothetical protein [uncultured Parasphingorhabdus sp.]|uniref:hypothetical protein n=1 Tax=uncultured Parasphingorhabdus sp. TaxID=2709694 RepID=UPI0030D8C580